jgi:pimeloyl-ACP methyl ester carboxylesterase
MLSIPVNAAVASEQGLIPLSAYTQAHLRIEVEPGRRLNVFCLGKGDPVVIFEAGGGDDSASFRAVQARVALRTRACSYDRAGIGFSDPAAWPSTAANTVADLHRLITVMSPGKPVVLVGHSDGGLYVPLYAATYPGDVTGMVLIDPFTVGADEIAAALLTPRQRAHWYASDNKDIAHARACVELADKRLLVRPDHQMSTCLDNPSSADPARHRELNRQLAHSSEQKALLSALIDTYPAPDQGMSAAELALQNAHPDFGDTPLIVLTAGEDEQTDLPQKTRLAIAAAWRKNNDLLAARSREGRNIIVPKSHHDIQKEQPAAVIDAVSKVVDAARKKSGLPATLP